jgi:hypothetical protein
MRDSTATNCSYEQLTGVVKTVPNQCEAIAAFKAS